jgi:hypothetical protein
MIEPQDCLQQPPEAESHRLASFNFRITPALMAEWFNVRELAVPNRSDGLEGNQSRSVSISGVPGMDLMIQRAPSRSPGGQTHV